MGSNNYESVIGGGLQIARKALWGWEVTVLSQMGGLEVDAKALRGVIDSNYESDTRVS